MLGKKFAGLLRVIGIRLPLPAPKRTVGHPTGEANDMRPPPTVVREPWNTGTNQGEWGGYGEGAI